MTLSELYYAVSMVVGELSYDSFERAAAYAINKRSRIEKRKGIALDDDYLVKLTVEAVAVVEFSDFCSEVEQTLSEIRQGA